MPSVLHKANSQTDWFEEICQQLDALRLDSLKFKDDEDILPSDADFETVKQYFQNLRRLSGFPTLPRAHAWIGPEGQIGLTWKTPDVSFDLIFGIKFIARLSAHGNQKFVELSEVPVVMSKLAA